MKSKNKQILLVALAVTLACSGLVLGQDSAALTVEPSVSKAPDTAVNNTREGRSLNRRAQITVLVNKGISTQGKTQAASQEQLPPRP